MWVHVLLPANPAQVVALEHDLMESVAELKKRNWITGTPAMLDKIIEPDEEKKANNSPDKFEGGEAEIIAEVRCRSK